MLVSDTDQSAATATDVDTAPASDAPPATAVQTSALLVLSSIVRGRNPRTYFDPVEMAKLTASAKKRGIFTPILVRPLADGTFRIIAGERRYRAALAAHGIDYKIPALIRDCSDEEEAALALIENTHREPMSATEEAARAAEILGDCNGDRNEAALIMGMSRAMLDSRLALMNCSESVQTALNEKRISLGHAELFAGLAKDVQDRLLPVIVAEKRDIADLKKVIENAACKLDAAVFNKVDCGTCHHNSTLQSSMFAESLVGGSCTNRACYTKKTEERLDEIAGELKDSYPVVRIVRAGDNSTLIKLTAEGPVGVGKEQATACRGCSKFGAAVSALPQSLAKVFENQCFDPACNNEKVQANIAAVKAAAEAAPTAPTEQPGKQGSKAEKKPPTEKVTSVHVGDRIKAYREAVWRTAMKRVLAKDSVLSSQYLLAMCMNGNGRNVDTTALKSAFQKLSGVDLPHELGEIAAAVQGTDEVTFGKMTTLIAASMMDELPVHDLTRLLRHHKLDLTQFWALEKPFLDLLTKSEIAVVALEIGLDKAIGDGYAKLLTEKKDVLIETLLKVDSFNYSATIPTAIRYTA